MKKVLLTSTALVAFTGAAVADVELSGRAEMGIFDADAVNAAGTAVVDQELAFGRGRVRCRKVEVEGEGRNLEPALTAGAWRLVDLLLLHHVGGDGSFVVAGRAERHGRDQDERQGSVH